MLNFNFVFLLLLFTLAIISCISTNYYTARTLAKGETVLLPGLDNLLMGSNEAPKKEIVFTPDMGIARGLCYLLEAGVRYSFPFLLEGNVHYQLNPESFKWFDLSANLNSGVFFRDNFRQLSNPFLKYGLILSKRIRSAEPYFSFYFINHFLSYDNDKEEFLNFKNFTIGIALPVFKYNKLFPEINYLRSESTGKGIYTFSIGFRFHFSRN